MKNNDLSGTRIKQKVLRILINFHDFDEAVYHSAKQQVKEFNESEKNIPLDLEWKQTPGNYGILESDSNHWDLWSPSRISSNSPEEYVELWNNIIAPQLAKMAETWSVIK
jgi:hypothetical protein